MDFTSPAAGRIMERDVLVTGEAVELEVQASSPFMRALAGIIDAGVVLSFLALLLYVSAKVVDLDNMARSLAFFTVLFLLAFLVFPATIEWATKGRSVGKAALGMQVVRDDGGPISLRHTMIRALTSFIEGWLTLGGVAFLFMLANGRSKRGGDLLAGTHVITGGVRASDPLPFLAPPELAGWMEVADVRRLPPHLATAVRRFLLSTSTLAPAHRQELGMRLASQCEPLVSPPPPWGTHPERFLVALSCVRRDREYAQRLRSQEKNRAEVEAALADVGGAR
ncbi:RDD family protein [Buchananella felis]|uniref:RDD family protein n=1 Tax=Buchananella felis TaxID=3231492 RepID=UPI0035288101